ncbi:MAG TPA: tetratricopeptide repeat protein [Patescibacteria group bacterium]|nr:tetratricopeptide repeat protein [Patescibacteria group bacterium]
MIFYIALGIIVVCLVAVGYIVVSKFPQLANLDVQNLPEEKESKKKKEILNQRIDEQGRRLQKRLGPLFRPIRHGWGLLQLKFRVYVGKMERLWHHEQRLEEKKARAEMSSEEKETRLEQILKEAEICRGSGELDKAEELYIGAIKIKPNSVVAYRGLGETYLAKESLEEARQTFKYLCQLDKNDEQALVKLGEIAEKEGKIEKAIEYYERAIILNDSLSPRFYHLAELLMKVNQPQVAKEAIVQAVELEPKNPKYLDLLIEIAIISLDKALATKGYEELRLVNPDNQKLVEFKERMGEMK